MWQRCICGKTLSILPLTLLIAVFVLAGCDTSQMPTSAPLTAATVEPVATPAAVEETAVAAESDTQAPRGVALPPVSLTIPEIDMDVQVVPMSWYVAETEGVRTTAWQLPQEGAGWHPNSAGAGSDGNVVISGHQLLGDAPFAPIALGDVAVGMEVVLADAEGNRFSYIVTEVTEPLPIPSSLAEEEDLAAQYAAPTSVPSLTLISGWPDFSTTHRIIVRAELVNNVQ